MKANTSQAPAGVQYQSPEHVAANGSSTKAVLHAGFEALNQVVRLSRIATMDPTTALLRMADGKVDVRLPGKGNENSHGARPVHLIITMIKWMVDACAFGVWGSGVDHVVEALEHLRDPGFGSRV